MSYVAGVLLLVFAVAVMIGAVLQVAQWRRGRHIISRGQLISRLVTAVLLLLVIAMIFLGVAYPWPETRTGALAELGLWACLMVLLVAVMVLAMNDLRQVDRQRHIRQAEIYRAIQDLQDKTSGKADKPPTGGTPG